MLRYIARRLLALVPVVFLVSVFAFIIIHITPGDPVSLVLGEQATATEVQEAREELGLNDPIYVQYFRWITQIAQGNLGTSLIYDQPVSQMLIQRAEPTLLLASVGLFFAVGLGIPSGVIAAIKNNQWTDHGIMFAALLFVATPNFFLGLLLIIFIALNVGAIPTGGYTHIGDEGIFAALLSVVLPAFSLGASQAALVARMTRASMLEVLGTDYVRTARAKGLPSRAVHVRHALKNALLPTTTVLGVVVLSLFGGAVVTETVFAIGGAGRLVVNSVQNRDYPVVQGALIVIASLYVLVNLFVDILYVYIDPRIRYT